MAGPTGTMTGSGSGSFANFLSSIGSMGATLPNPGAPMNLLSNVESFGTSLTNTFNAQSGIDAAMVSANSQSVFSNVMPFINKTAAGLTTIGQQFATASQTAASNLGGGKKG